MNQDICFGNIVVDCNDEQQLCRFYKQLLGWEKREMYGHPAVRSEAGLVFLFVQDEEYVSPIWPDQLNKQQKQMHFDFQVDDVTAAVQRAEVLGAVKAKSQFGGENFVTMLDPAGHPFCLCAKG